jgi:hypothetical protein
MLNFWDANARALIAFFLALIAALLTYIAFFRESNSSKKSSKVSRRKA